MGVIVPAKVGGAQAARGVAAAASDEVNGVWEGAGASEIFCEVHFQAFSKRASDLG